MVDLQETPAVPPEEPGGDERIGYYIAGTLFLIFGWGTGVLLNLLVHWGAPSDGRAFLGTRIFAHLGPFAQSALVLGLLGGAFGVVLIALGRSSPKGSLRLPGYPY